MLEVASPFAMNLYQDIIGAKGGIPDLADRLDRAHMTALQNSGLTLFTGKNRLIMRFPASAQTATLGNPTSSIIPKARFLKGSAVPCEDSAQNRKTELAGRLAANKRKAVMHNHNHAKSPQMDLSLC